MHSRIGRCLKITGLLLVVVAIQPPPLLNAQHLTWGSSVRGYEFLRIEHAQPATRWDTEFATFRLTTDFVATPKIKFESHAIVSLLSPPFSAASRVATSYTFHYLPLQHSFLNEGNANLTAGFDRLNLQLDFKPVRIVLGRQPITWGVSYFWPVMDLFAPFAPERIDRDYKAGVDAVRFTIPMGSYSEIDVVGASLGPSPSKDWAAGALARIHAGRVDFGFMGGKFHRDTVAGGFFTSSLRGTGFRGEVTWTDSGDPQDQARDRTTFWRGTLGADRQLTPAVTLTLELALNGYGVADPSEYLSMITADRILRGEVNGLGRIYAGAATTWQFHPLWMFSNAILVNGNDPSALWIPTLTWSSGNNSDILFGAQVSIGIRPAPGQVPRSEYGSIPASLFAGFKKYF
jgi:hypothetical protein